MTHHHDGPPFPTGEHETTESLARGILAAAYAEPEPIPCALCPAVVERLDAHWHEELHDEVCPDCCPTCTKENDR